MRRASSQTSWRWQCNERWRRRRKTNKTLKNHLVDRVSSCCRFILRNTIFHSSPLRARLFIYFPIRRTHSVCRQQQCSLCTCTCEDACNRFEIDANVILTPKSCGKKRHSYSLIILISIHHRILRVPLFSQFDFFSSSSLPLFETRYCCVCLPKKNVERAYEHASTYKHTWSYRIHMGDLSSEIYHFISFASTRS